MSKLSDVIYGRPLRIQSMIFVMSLILQDILPKESDVSFYVLSMPYLVKILDT